MDSPTSPIGARLRVLLADDHEPFRQRVRQLLRKTPDLELVGEAGDGEEVLRLAGALKPEIVVMDVVMPRLSGLEATRRMAGEFPWIKIIALSLHGDDGFRRAMLDAGASLYLLKDNVRHELPEALRSVAARLRASSKIGRGS